MKNHPSVPKGKLAENFSEELARRGSMIFRNKTGMMQNLLRNHELKKNTLD